MTIFGPLFHAGQLEASVITALKTWLHTYLLEVERQTEREENSLARPKSYSVVSEHERWPENHLPAIIVAAAGLLETPVKDGEGYYRGRWGVEVAAVCSASSGAATRELAMIYAAAVRGAMLQRRSLGEDLQCTDWLDESYDDVPSEQRRSLVSASNVFAVERSRILSVQEGPLDPESVPDEWPTISAAELAIEKE